MPTKDYFYMVINDNKVLYKEFFIYSITVRVHGVAWRRTS